MTLMDLLQRLSDLTGRVARLEDRSSVIDLGSGSAGTGSGMVLARVTAGSGTAHTCSLYANGSGESATATGVAVTTPNVATGEVLPVNSWLWVTQINATYYGLGTVWQ